MSASITIPVTMSTTILIAVSISITPINRSASTTPHLGVFDNDGDVDFDTDVDFESDTIWLR